MGDGVRSLPVHFPEPDAVTLAAVQAPIIMMSQNRAAAKDRKAASLDYEINLRAELEIMRLHHKIDALVEKVEGLGRGSKG